MPLKLNSASGGSVTLDVPATASNFTLTVPAATGTVLTTASTSGMAVPAFNYVASISQSITPATFTKVTFASQVFDTTSGMFSSSRFTPTVAGYYQFNAHLCIGNTTLTRTTLNFYKNGAQYSRPWDDQMSISGSPRYVNASALIYCNGTTDYIEIYTYLTGSGLSLSVLAANEVSTFSGVLVRAA